MNLEEYNKIKDFTYLEYCDYLQHKYGLPPKPYMTEKFVKSGWSKKCNSRTNEGLFLHHKYEDHAILLGDEEHASKNPYTWQLQESLVYCNYLEHLFLHILICEYPKNKRKNEIVGIGGIQNFIGFELCQYYNGLISKNEPWRNTCFDMVKKYKLTYLTLLERFKTKSSNYPLFDEKLINYLIDKTKKSPYFN